DKDIAYILMDYKTLQSLKGNSTDCSGYSSKLLTIENINYSFSLIEKEPGLMTLSMRSRAGYNVRLASEKLGGGGHSCAAGAKINATSLNKIKKEVIDAIRQK
ncbi:MAG: hypothetical protein IJX25_03545, partial [Clostridia bacterium]|nr:hypothetical protein [Clostridia bacterium]